MIPSCFSLPNSPSSKNHRHHNQEDHHREEEEEEEEDEDGNNNNESLITCIYQTEVFESSEPTYLTLTWSKTLNSHTLTIHASDNSLYAATVSLKPPTFSLFGSKRGSKSIHIMDKNKKKRKNDDNNKMRLYWDFSGAEFRNGSAEPERGFYVAIAPSRAENGYIGFFVGEVPWHSPARLGSMMLSRREHAFGRRRRYSSRVVISGSRRQIGIECNGGTMRVSVEGETRLVVQRLAWKFRGNEQISIGGEVIEFFWDVFNWVTGDGKGHAVFAFQAGDGGVWPPEIIGRSERKLLRKSFSSSSTDKTNNCYISKSPSWSSVLEWAEQSSDVGSRSSCSSLARSSVDHNYNGGFSLLLYAWNKD